MAQTRQLKSWKGSCPASHEMEDEYNQGDYQNYVNDSPCNVSHETQTPQNQQDDGNS